MELHAFKHEVPGSSPGGSNMRGHSSTVEHEVSSNPCRRTLIVAIKDTGETVKIPVKLNTQSVENNTLAFDLAALGYAGFSQLTAYSKRNPAGRDVRVTSCKNRRIRFAFESNRLVALP